MRKNKILNLLGLARRSNNLIMGTDAILNSFSEIKMIFLTIDASDRTKDKITKKAFHYNIPVVIEFTTVELSNSLGKKNLKIIGLSDEGFINKINELLNGEKRGDQYAG